MFIYTGNWIGFQKYARACGHMRKDADMEHKREQLPRPTNPYTGKQTQHASQWTYTFITIFTPMDAVEDNGK